MGSSTTLHGVSLRLRSIYWARSPQEENRADLHNTQASSLIVASLSNSILALRKNVTSVYHAHA